MCGQACKAVLNSYGTGNTKIKHMQEWSVRLEQPLEYLRPGPHTMDYTGLVSACSYTSSVNVLTQGNCSLPVGEYLYYID